MMGQVLRRIRWSLILAAASSVAAALAYHDYLQSRGAAETAVGGWHVSQRQAAEIVKLRSRPVFAVTSVESLGELTQRIAQARSAAGITEQAIDLVDPQPTTRLGDSAYRQRPVAIDLRGLSLDQAVRFTSALTDRDQGMWVNRLRLSSVREEPGQNREELWNVELVLTQVNYSPTSR